MAFLGLVPSERSTGEIRRQGGKGACARRAGRGRMDLPTLCRLGCRAPAPAAGTIGEGPRHRLESSGASLRAVSTPRRERQAPHRSDDRDRARRARRVLVGHRTPCGTRLRSKRRRHDARLSRIGNKRRTVRPRACRGCARLETGHGGELPANAWRPAMSRCPS
jgi:hypothetical protein